MKESLTLSCQTGSAEHLYQPGIQACPGGYAVIVAHGRRGTALQTDTKTAVPVSYSHAKRIYDGLVAKKTASGYVPVAGPPIPPMADPLPMGSVAPTRPLRPQLIEPGRAARILNEPDWCVQEIFRGRRLLLCKTPERITGVATDGRLVAVPEPVRAAAEKTKFNWLMDGVLVGDTFMAFDLPQLEAMNFRSLPYRLRLSGLRVLLVPPDPHLRIAETVMERVAKAGLVQRLREQQKDGVVLKKLSGTYPCGYPAGQDRWLQCAFTATWPTVALSN